MPPKTEWKVILIDDEKDIREVVSVALEDEGYNVTTAKDGQTGIHLCEKISPQIVITDIRMPGMDGIQVLELIKEAHPEIEVIVITAFGDMEKAVQALQLDASDFIPKPINTEALNMALKRAQNRFTARKQLKDYATLLEEEHLQTTQELMESIAFQRNLIESSMDGILGFDRNRKVVAFNKSMERILGYSKHEVRNKMTFNQFFPPKERQLLEMELASESYGGPTRLFLYETNLLNRKGQKVPVQVSATVLYEEGRKNGFVCFFRDLRKLHRLEREIADQARVLHQDKMMSLGRLSASVVHEINNPLFGVLNYVRLMARILKRGPLGDDQQKKFQQYLDLVESETNRCSMIISNLLTFSRRSPPSYGRVHINELLDRCAIMSQHKLELSNIKLVHAVDPDMPPVLGDFNQLQQCIFNLIFNAIDAMPEGGHIRMEACYDAVTEKVNVTVKDTGPGISQQDIPHLFEPFFTTKDEGYGVGLGLSTVYGIMEHHQGTVRVESTQGEGSSFTLEIPLFTAESETGIEK